MATKKELISDIKLRLSKGKPSDDFEVDDRQIGFWLDTVRAELIKAKADKEKEYDFSDFVELFECVDITKLDKCADDGCDSVWYKSKLPAAIMSLPNDKGILSIETQGGSEVRRLSLTDRIRFKSLKFAKPSKCKPTYYRVNDEVFYSGGTDSWLNNGSVNMYLVTENTTTEGEFPISSEMLPELLEEVEQIGMRMLFNNNKEDLENDGRQ